MTLLMTSAMIDDAMILWRSAARRHERCLASGATRSVHWADDPEDRMGINSLKMVYIYIYVYRELSSTCWFTPLASWLIRRGSGGVQLFCRQRWDHPRIGTLWVYWEHQTNH